MQCREVIGMSKGVKRLIIVILSIAVLAAAIWGVMTLIRNANKKPVNVYAVSDVCMTGYYGDMSQSYGSVTTENMQKIYVSDTQTITEIYVKVGQEVKAGEPLFKYDSTMSEIDLKKAEINLEKKKLELDTTQKELQALYSAVSLEALQSEYDYVARQYEAEYEAEASRRADAAASRPKPPYPELPLGGWTESNPRYVNADDTGDIDSLFAESGLDDIYVVFVTVRGTEYTDYNGVRLTKTDTVRLRFFKAAELQRQGGGEEESGEEVIDNDTLRALENQMEYLSYLMSNSYPRDELLRMQNEKEKRIGELDIEIRMADVELKRKQKEFDNGAVLAEIDGVVTFMEYPEIANANSQPSLIVSAGGGYLINATVSELDLATVNVGQTVTVNSWSTGVSCEGVISEIGNEPVQTNYYSSADNNNVSWYPLIISVDGEYNLKEEDYVEVSYAKAATNPDAWYLQNMMIRQENGQSYVYVRGGDGLLEKRFIQTGKDLWGSYTEIRAGLDMDDRIAFPYGKDVTEGAKTQEAEAASLYNGL